MGGFRDAHLGLERVRGVVCRLWWRVHIPLSGLCVEGSVLVQHNPRWSNGSRGDVREDTGLVARVYRGDYFLFSYPFHVSPNLLRFVRGLFLADRVAGYRRGLVVLVRLWVYSQRTGGAVSVVVRLFERVGSRQDFRQEGIPFFPGTLFGKIASEACFAVLVEATNSNIRSVFAAGRFPSPARRLSFEDVVRVVMVNLFGRGVPVGRGCVYVRVVRCNVQGFFRKARLVFLLGRLLFRAFPLSCLPSPWGAWG